MGDIATVKIEDFAERIKARIRAEFVEAIPDAAFSTMIKTEVETFFKAKVQYGNQIPSPFQRMVDKILSERARELVREVLQSEWWREQYTADHQALASKAVVDLIVKRLPDVMTALVGGMIQQVVTDVRNRM